MLQLLHFQPYDTRSHLPKILGCFHTFCSKCIDRWKANVRLACPQCRKDCQVEQISVNYALAEVLEHCKRPETRSTNNISSPRRNPRCQEHGLDFRYLCMEDNKLICIDCFALSHSGHQCKSITAACEEERVLDPELFNKAEHTCKVYQDAREAIIKALGNRREREVVEERKLEEEYAKAIIKLQERKQEALQNIRKVQDQKDKLLALNLPNIEGNIALLKDGLGEINGAGGRNDVSPVVELMTRRRFRAQMEELAKASLEIPCGPEGEVKLDFVDLVAELGIQLPSMRPSKPLILNAASAYLNWETGQGPNGGEGICFDITAKSRQVLVDGFRVYCKEGSGRSYEVYFRHGSAKDLCITAAGWTNVYTEHGVPEKQARHFKLAKPLTVPAGATIGVCLSGFVKYSNTEVGALIAENEDCRISALYGVSTKFSSVYGGRGFIGELHYSK